MFGLGINKLGTPRDQALPEPETLLFSNAEEGTFLDFTTSQVYADTAGTDPAEVGEGVAFVDDKSPNDTDATQATSTARPIFARVPVGGRRNRVSYSEDFSNAVWAVISGGTGVSKGSNAELAPNGTLTAAAITFQAVSSGQYSLLRQSGTGACASAFLYLKAATPADIGKTIHLYSANVDRNVAHVLTGGWVKVENNEFGFLPNGSFTFGVLGPSTWPNGVAQDTVNVLVWGAQAEVSPTPSAYQKVVTQHDVTETGIPSVYHSVWDKSDDILPITLPAITGGTVALVGLNGIWIEDDWDYAGGTLDIGPTTIAGLPAGILSVVGNLCAVIINDRAWTAAERAGVVAWGKARGAPGVFELGEELINDADWQLYAGATSGGSVTAGVVTFTPDAGSPGWFGTLAKTIDSASYYVTTFRVDSAGGTYFVRAGNAVSNNSIFSYTNPTKEKILANSFSGRSLCSLSLGIAVGQTGVLSNASLRKLELIP